jgi:alginate O-acetyltransferase complex protein AlgI
MIALGASGTGLWDDTASFYLQENYTVLLLALLVSVPLVNRLKKNKAFAAAADVIRPFFVLLILLLSISFMVKGAYNPFIYFNF